MRYAFFLLLLIPIFLPSCGPRYHPKPLKSIAHEPSYHQQIGQIDLSVAQLNKKEANALFDQRGGRLIRKRKPTHLLLLTITNNGPHSIHLHKNNISVSLTSDHIIASRLHAHLKRRVISTMGIGIIGASITFIAAAYISIIGVIGTSYFAASGCLIKAGYGLLGASGLILLTLPLAGYKQISHAVRINQLIDKDVQSKIFSKELIIEPGQTAQTILAIDHKKFTSEFTMIFKDLVTHEPFLFTVTVLKGGL